MTDAAPYLVSSAHVRVQDDPFSPILRMTLTRRGWRRPPADVIWREPRRRDGWTDQGVSSSARSAALGRMDRLLDIARDAHRRIRPLARELDFRTVSIELDIAERAARLRVVLGVDELWPALTIELRQDSWVPVLGPSLDPIVAIGSVALESAVETTAPGAPLEMAA